MSIARTIGFLFLALLLTAGAAAQPAAVVAVAVITGPAVVKYAKFEAAAQLNKQFENPYNPDLIDIEVEFTSPTGKQYQVYAFYLVPFTRGPADWLPGPTTTPWHVRFCPNETGSWTYRFAVTDKSAPAAPTRTPSRAYGFSCTVPLTPGLARPGFLRVAANKRYLEFSEGQSFFGISEDLRASFAPSFPCNTAPDCPNGRPCYSFKTQPQQLSWIRYFHGQGGNLVRVWLEPYSYEPEWEELGYYAAAGRQRRAADLDQLIEYADANATYIHLVLYNSRALSRNEGTKDEGSGWADNPYKTAFGLDSMSEFYQNPRTIAAFKHRLRYIHSRWGYSPAIASYGLMNEPEMPDDSRTAQEYRTNIRTINAWFDTMAAFVKNTGYPVHLVSIDYTIAVSSAVNHSPNIDFTNSHYYSSDKNVSYQRAYIAQHHVAVYDKPYAQTESGPTNWMSEGRNEEVRQGIWSSAFSGAFSTAFYFGADTKYNNDCAIRTAIRLFEPLHKFLAGEVFNSPDFTYQPIGNAFSAYNRYRYQGQPLEDRPPRPDVPAHDDVGFALSKGLIVPDSQTTATYLARDIATSTPRIEVFALRSPQKILGWLHDKDYYWYNLPHHGNPAVDTLPGPNLRNGQWPNVAPLTAQTMTISGLAPPDGVFVVDWYSTVENYSLGGPPVDGGPIASLRATATAHDGTLVVSIPSLVPTELGKKPFAPDYGFKITPQPPAAPARPARPAPLPPRRRH